MEKSGSTPQGMGNQCSVEFNLAYRWHSPTSAGDEKYIEQIYEDLMGKPAEEVSIPELLMGLGKYEKSMDPDPSKRTFAKLQRQEDGTFRDEELVGILSDASEDVASKSICDKKCGCLSLIVFARLFRCAQCSQGPEIH